MTPGAAVLQRYVEARLAEQDRIVPGRRRALDDLAEQLAARLREEAALDLLFVCTHNSRRSHLGQVWAYTAARHSGLSRVRTWSGGTEVTRCAPQAVAALRRAGFHAAAEGEGDNPVLLIRASERDEPLRCWSKRLSDAANPQVGSVAVMLCASADAACPTVPGAALRTALPYDDPKAFDGTVRETEAYDQCCAEIARDMLYLFGAVAARV